MLETQWNYKLSVCGLVPFGWLPECICPLLPSAVGWKYRTGFYEMRAELWKSLVDVLPSGLDVTGPLTGWGSLAKTCQTTDVWTRVANIHFDCVQGISTVIDCLVTQESMTRVQIWLFKVKCWIFWMNILLNDMVMELIQILSKLKQSQLASIQT